MLFGAPTWTNIQAVKHVVALWQAQFTSNIQSRWIVLWVIIDLFKPSLPATGLTSYFPKQLSARSLADVLASGCFFAPSFKRAATVGNQGLVMDKESVPMPELKQTSSSKVDGA